MKKPSISFLSALVLLFAANTLLFAQSSEESAGRTAEQAGKLREALTHYVAALQSVSEGSADDQRLREAIIKVVQKLSPPPAVPEEARRFSVRGQVAIKEAKNPSDFAEAAKEFGKALRVAPWWTDGYINQGVALEKAGRFNEAARALKFYLLAAPNAPDAQNVKDQIYALEYRQEKGQRETVAKKEEQDRKRREEEARAINPARLVGKWCKEISGIVNCQTPYYMSVSGNTFEIVMTDRWVRNGNWLLFHGTVKGDQLAGFSRPFIFGLGAHSCPPQQVPMQGRISPDGKRMEITHTQVGAIYDNCAFKVAEIQTWVFVKQ